MDDKFKKLQEFLKENKLDLKIRYDFPTYKVLPIEVELALKVIEKHNIVFSIEVTASEPRAVDKV